MSGIWHATALLVGRGLAIAVTTGAIFSLAGEVGSLSPSSVNNPASTQATVEQSGARSSTGFPEAATTAAPTAISEYKQAIAIANEAVVAYQSAKQASDPQDRLSFTRREYALWQAALQKLADVPESAANYAQATEKRSQYKILLATAKSKLVAGENAFLKTIVDSAGVAPKKVHITLCQIDSGQISRSGIGQDTAFADENSCRHHQGDSLLASPASLIKLPIAIALMDKVEQENRPLSTEIYIDPSNFTENAEGASIEIDREYPLAQVMVRMINESNNIATNQLIDYVGRDRIAKTMADRGHKDTLVDFKLAGDRILPPNPGTQSNQLTSNDLTAMMVQIYGLENPGDEELLKALLSQQDREIGHTALQDLDPAIAWLGEKTGQNDRLIGTTLAMKVGAERYALTVAIDYSGDIHGLQTIIRSIAKHLLEAGPLVDTSRDSASYPQYRQDAKTVRLLAGINNDPRK